MSEWPGPAAYGIPQWEPAGSEWGKPYSLRARAIEAAAKVRLEAQAFMSWEAAPEGLRDGYRCEFAPLVDAVLAVAAPAYWDEGYEEHEAPHSIDKRNPYRADAEETS